MREIIITANDAGRRLDRFLRKYLKDAALSDIYKFIRKDVKVDGRRRSESYILNEGETLTLYLSDETLEKLVGSASKDGAGIQSKAAARILKSPGFGIVYEDDEILIADKPYGLLTHGDSREKKDHLANRVKDYLIASGFYNPRTEKVFTPAPANRLDRNTTGMVLFGKTSAAMRELTRMIRENEISKHYLTLACGIIEEEELHLTGTLLKDEADNRVSVSLGGEGLHSAPGEDDAKQKIQAIETFVHPLEYAEFGRGYSASLCEVELITGRTHQIRAHLAAAGHPLVGDGKYEIPEFAALNRYCKDKLGLSTQLLHAYRMEFSKSTASSEVLGYLAGRSFKSPMPGRFSEIFWKLYG